MKVQLDLKDMQEAAQEWLERRMRGQVEVLGVEPVVTEFDGQTPQGYALKGLEVEVQITAPATMDDLLNEDDPWEEAEEVEADPAAPLAELPQKPSTERDMKPVGRVGTMPEGDSVV